MREETEVLYSPPPASCLACDSTSFQPALSQAVVYRSRASGGSSAAAPIELSLLRRQLASRSRQTSSLFERSVPYSSARIPNSVLTMLDTMSSPVSNAGLETLALSWDKSLDRLALCASTGRSCSYFRSAQQTRSCNLRRKELVGGFF